jgi:hypothetical protein
VAEEGRVRFCIAFTFFPPSFFLGVLERDALALVLYLLRGWSGEAEMKRGGGWSRGDVEG